MSIKIDQQKCIGCGRCTEICSNVFRLNAEGRSEIIDKKDTDCAMKAADECPTGAIFVEE